MAGTILLGVDVEKAGAASEVYARCGVALLEAEGIRGSWYVTGKTLEMYPEAFREADASGVVDIEGHTYSHMLLKTVLLQVPGGLEIHGTRDAFMKRGGSVAEVDADLERCQGVFEEVLGRRVIGLTGPWGYYRGLGDRPDLLEVVYKYGYRFLRTYARDERDGQPVPMEVQPYFYKVQGFGDVLELGVQGYQDDFYYMAFNGLTSVESYAGHLRGVADRVAREDLVWNLCSHDHGCETEESFREKTSWMVELIRYAKGLGIEFMTGKEYYEERRQDTGYSRQETVGRRQ